jgi:hypothetical protein
VACWPAVVVARASTARGEVCRGRVMQARGSVAKGVVCRGWGSPPRWEVHRGWGAPARASVSRFSATVVWGTTLRAMGSVLCLLRRVSDIQFMDVGVVRSLKRTNLRTAPPQSVLTLNHSPSTSTHNPSTPTHNKATW